MLFWLPDAYANVFTGLSQVSPGLHFAKLREANTLSSLLREHIVSLIILPLCPVGFIFLYKAGKNFLLNISQGLLRLSGVGNDTLLSWEKGTGSPKWPILHYPSEVKLCSWIPDSELDTSHIFPSQYLSSHTRREMSASFIAPSFSLCSHWILAAVH